MTKNTTEHTINFPEYFHEASHYGFQEFLEIIGELSQQSTKKGKLGRLEKELITLGLALYKNCRRCIDIHTANVEKLGATEKNKCLINNVVLFMLSCQNEKAVLHDDWVASWKRFSYSKKIEKSQLREMTALAISIVRQDHAQIRLHFHETMRTGITIEQIFEIVSLVLLMDGAPTLSQIPVLVRSYHHFLRENTANN